MSTKPAMQKQVKPQEEVYLFPTLGISVVAKSREEALEQVESDNGKAGDGNS